MQQRLKPASRSARTRIVAPELFAQFLVAVDDAVAASDAGFGRESPAPFAGDFKSGSRRVDVVSWRRPPRIEKGRSISASPLRDSPAASYSPVTPSLTVPSALRGLTAVFGMGTGVSPSPWRPETLPMRLRESDSSSDKLNVGSSFRGKRLSLVCD